MRMFIGIGMLAGSEGPGGIPYDDPRSAQFLGVVALAFILFDGGLQTDRKAVSGVFRQGLSLATIGVFLTAVAVGWFASSVLGFSRLEGFLLGCIVSSTDAAAVFAVLRSQRIGLKGTARPLLELESGSNDPMAVFLTMAVISLIGDPERSWISILPMFVLQMGVGAAVGAAAGKGAGFLLNRLKLEVRVHLPEDSILDGKRIMDLALPESALVALIARGDDFIAPRGSTTVARGDTLLVLADKTEIPALRALIEGAARTDDGQARTSRT